MIISQKVKKCERVNLMKFVVEADLCISCGACISLCPDVFDWDDNDKAKAIPDDVPSEQEDSAVEAMESCPTDAIKKE